MAEEEWNDRDKRALAAMDIGRLRVTTLILALLSPLSVGALAVCFINCGGGRGGGMALMLGFMGLVELFMLYVFASDWMKASRILRQES